MKLSAITWSEAFLWLFCLANLSITKFCKLNFTQLYSQVQILYFEQHNQTSAEQDSSSKPSLLIFQVANEKSELCKHDEREPAQNRTPEQTAQVGQVQLVLEVSSVHYTLRTRCTLPYCEFRPAGKT
jgi:hypothetical protein